MCLCLDIKDDFVLYGRNFNLQMAEKENMKQLLNSFLQQKSNMYSF